jgi:hypothetical protein
MDITAKSAGLVPIPQVPSADYPALLEHSKQISEKFKGMTHEQMFSNFDISRTYARATYTGFLTEITKDLTAWELAVVCDGGFSWFGGSSHISSNGFFTVVIYTD